ncbi:MAG: hypothetical protein GEV28_30905 [Actinophytocola sp.]|uniref:hypothetical protein n=1 Tax=Actinophytocola sp. TaxID=1872138 RepID=UPI001326581B|nr:hypothetical protein [Actinophytocola sp.]MPZ84560.1 hypothetical protein [Actinophytocola sp.]
MLFSHPLTQQATSVTAARPDAAYGALFREPELADQPADAGDFEPDFEPDIEPEYVPRVPSRPRRNDVRARRTTRRRSAA